MKPLKKTVAMILLLCLLLSACAQMPAGGQDPSEETFSEPPEQTEHQESSAQPQTDSQAEPESQQEEKRSAFDVLPVPEVDPSSDFGVDVNVNIATVDQ